MNVNVAQSRATEGLAGAVNRGNWLPALSNGSQLGPRPASLIDRHKQVYELLGNSWRVTAATSLFDYDPGTSTASYTLASWPVRGAASCVVAGAPPQIPVRPALAPIPAGTAQQMCGAIVDPARRGRCAIDVAALGDAALVNGYKAVEVNTSNRKPNPSTLLEPANRTVSTSTVVTFKWKAASDPDGHPVSYRHCLWPSDEGFTVNACEAPTPYLSRTVTLPKGKQYEWKVLTEDGRGASTDSATRFVKVK
ncbi:MAG: hypothetical protein JNK82_39695 [Myxococcaceae bacterium]|nr:hypothetical protein [Myxococcaceae bacterium]